MQRVQASHGFDKAGLANLPALLATYRQTWFEIGIGAGEHLAWQAQQNPSTLCLGAEYYLNGFARACKYVEDEALANVRLHLGDGRDVMDALPAQSLSRVFILHPDPWPKARQWCRRIVNGATLDRLATLLHPGGVLRLASDHKDYQPWILRVLLAHRAFEWAPERHQDWAERPADWPQTRYEAKAIASARALMYLEARRR